MLSYLSTYLPLLGLYSFPCICIFSFNLKEILLVYFKTMFYCSLFIWIHLYFTFLFHELLF